MTRLTRLALLTSLLLPCPVIAGSIGPYLAYVAIDEGEEASGVGAKLEIDLNNEVSLEGRFTKFDDFDTDNTLSFFGVPSELEANAIELGLVFRIPVQDRIVPYIAAGGSLYLLDVSIQGQDLEFDDEFGWYAAGGLRLKLSENLSIFGEAQYRKIEGSLTGRALRNFGIREIDVKLDTIGANVGLLISW